MNRSEEVFKSATLAAPPLIVWSTTQRGWHSAPEIINSGLLDKQQLYAINTLRPTNEFEVKKPALASVAKYYAVVSQLLGNNSGPLASAVDNGTAFIWSCRSMNKRESIPSIRLNHYTCHSARAELAVAAYNVAVAMMQLTALYMSNLDDSADILRAMMQLTGHAERIFLGLADFSNLSSTTDVSPQQPQQAAFANGNHLNFLADWAFAQLSELWFVHFSNQMETSKAVGMGLTIVDAYEALYTKLSDQEELHSIVPGFLQRLVAIKRRYYMLQTSVLFLGNNEHAENDPAMLASLASMAEQTLSSLDKVPQPVSAISSAIRNDIQGIQESHSLALYKSDKAEASVLWDIIKQSNLPLIPGNSIRNSETTTMNSSLAPFASITELHSKIGQALAPRICLVAEKSAWSLKPEDADAQYLRSFYDSLAPYLPSTAPSTETSSTSTQAKSPTVVITDPRFERRNFLFDRLRRLGAMMMSLATISSILERIKTLRDASPEQTPQVNDKIHMALQQFCAQLIDHTQVIEHVFFDHTKSTFSNEPGAVPYVINPKDITSLAKAIVMPSNGGVTEIDNGILNKALDDTTTQPYVDGVIKLEELLREEMRPIWGYVKGLESSLPLTSS